MRAERRLRASDVARLRDELMALAHAWRRVLVDDPMNARPIVVSLLKRRVTIDPVENARKRWTLRGEGTLVGLFQKVISGDSFPLVWRPQRDRHRWTAPAWAGRCGRRRKDRGPLVPHEGVTGAARRDGSQGCINSRRGVDAQRDTPSAAGAVH
jgi:hypothetical protein